MPIFLGPIGPHSNSEKFTMHRIAAATELASLDAKWLAHKKFDFLDLIDETALLDEMEQLIDVMHPADVEAVTRFWKRRNTEKKDGAGQS